MLDRQNARETDTAQISDRGDSGAARSSLSAIELLSQASTLRDTAASPALSDFPAATLLLDQLSDPAKTDFPTIRQSEVVAQLGPVRDYINFNDSRNGRVDSQVVGRVLEDHNLRGSFTSQVISQLERDGKVRVGVIDDFSGTHGPGVVARLRGSLPDYIRDRVEIVRYDVSQGREQAFQAAISDANNKNIAVLSVSGGLEPVNLRGLEQSLGTSSINSNNRAEALNTALERFSGQPGYDQFRENMINLSQASLRIPVVTPGWNDGNITPATLGRNTIVTSLSGDNTNATPSALIDIRIAPISNNTFTSQTAPRVIGAMFGLVSQDQVTRATQRR
ncbi:MAG: hypothetical protein IAF58_17865 [Leptolyngbya sp.]|nr:hypothetical protein [Candidatus Melainabacteria bacterium]